MVRSKRKAQPASTKSYLIHKSRDQLREISLNLAKSDRQKSRHLELIQRVAIIANEAMDVKAALQTAVAEICRQMNWAAGHVYIVSTRNREALIDSGIWHFENHRHFKDLVQASRSLRSQLQRDLVGAAIRDREPKWLTDCTKTTKFKRARAAARSGVRMANAFPAMVGKRVWAVIEFFSPRRLPPEEGLLSVLGDIGLQLGRAFEREQLHQRVTQAIWREQWRIGQELHDTICQDLAGLEMMTRNLQSKLKTGAPDMAPRLLQIAELLHNSTHRARRIAHGLFPAEVDAPGLAAALMNLALTTEERYGIVCQFAWDEKARAPDDAAALHLYMIAKEALANAVKHADAGRIQLTLREQDHITQMVIADDGRGIALDTKQKTEGIGLQIMRHRAFLINANLIIQTADQGGTVVRCEFLR